MPLSPVSACHCESDNGCGLLRLIVWRIGNCRSPEGQGHLKGAGRWHNKGVIVPRSANYLFNTGHPDAKHCNIPSFNQHPFDRRLLARFIEPLKAFQPEMPTR